MQGQIGIGDIFRRYGPEYIGQNRIQGQQRGLIHLLSHCRTQYMGSHYESCDHCSYQGKSYNSCRNRLCPVCQQKDKLQWLEKRMEELLPVGYYHLVFTLPHDLIPLCRVNKKSMYGLLFQAASQTMMELCRDPRHLGADIGMITVLHTWGQIMMEHPHLHCIMPAGGLSVDRKHWIMPDKKGDFFIHAKVLSRKFRGKYLDLLKKRYHAGELIFPGKVKPLSGKHNFQSFIDKLYRKEWVVNIQAPMGRPERILEYLSRYVFRIAITDRRILGVRDGKVRFSWKDNRTGLFRQMSLEVNEFIRRFLLHTLPEGFFKVRYYGIFSSRVRKQNIGLAKILLQQANSDKQQEAREDGDRLWEKQKTIWDEISKAIRNYKMPNCPACKKGRLHFAGIVRDEQEEFR
jgi:hypothetical protein